MDVFGAISGLVGLIEALKPYVQNTEKRSRTLEQIRESVHQIFGDEAEFILKVLNKKYVADLLISEPNKREQLIAHFKDLYQENPERIWSTHIKEQVDVLVDKVHQILLDNDIKPIQAGINVVTRQQAKQHEENKRLLREIKRGLDSRIENETANEVGNVSNLPVSTQYFTGRKSYLEKLDMASAGSLTILSGLGGIGKTQLALQHVKQNQDSYNIKWLVRSEILATMQSDLGKLAVALKLADEDLANRTKIDRLVQHLINRSDWVLIFDNADDAEVLTEALNYLGEIRGKVIVTTRLMNWGNLATPIYVDTWEDDEVRTFLLNRLKIKPINDEDVATLCLALDNLPLAFEQAAAYINAVGITVGEYSELFISMRTKLWKDKTHEQSPADYEKSVATTWQISIEKTEEDFPGSRELLQICSLFAPDFIPIPLLVAGKDSLPGNLPELLDDRLTVLGVFATLEKYSLIDREQDFLFIHRLVQHVVRDSIVEVVSWIESVNKLLINTFPLKSGFPETYGLADLYATHMLFSADLLLEYEGDVLLATEVMVEASRALYIKGKMGEALQPFEAAEAVLERVLEVREHHFGINHESLASVLSLLADSKRRYAEQLNFVSSQSAYSKDPKSFEAISSIAFPLLERNRINQEATNLYERAHSLALQNSGKMSLDYVHKAGRLAMVYKDKAQYFGDDTAMQKAIFLQEESIALLHTLIETRQVLETELESHLHNFGLTLLSDSQHPQALEKLQEGLKLAKKIYPINSPDIAIFEKHIAYTLAAQGRHIEAASCFVKAAYKYRSSGMEQDYRDNAFNAMYCYKNAGLHTTAELYDVGFDLTELMDQTFHFDSIVQGYKSEHSSMMREMQAAIVEIYLGKLDEESES